MKPASQSSNKRLGQPLGGTNGDWRHRIIRFHVPLAFASLVVVFLWMTFPVFQAAGHLGSSQGGSQISGHQPPQSDGQAANHQGLMQAGSGHPAMEHSGSQTGNLDGFQNRAFMGQFTAATGYVAIGFLALTLLIEPANLLPRRWNPVSSYVRRDLGTWTAIVSVIHVIA